MKQHNIPFTLLYAWSNEFNGEVSSAISPNKNSRKNAKVKFSKVNPNCNYLSTSYAKPKIALANDVSISIDKYADELETELSNMEQWIGVVRSKIYRNNPILKQEVYPLFLYFYKRYLLNMKDESEIVKGYDKYFKKVIYILELAQELLKNSEKKGMILKVIKNKTGIPFITSSRLSFSWPNLDNTIDLVFPLTPEVLIGIRILSNDVPSFKQSQFTWHTQRHKEFVQQINRYLTGDAFSNSEIILPINSDEKSLFGWLDPWKEFSVDGWKNIEIKDMIRFNKS